MRPSVYDVAGLQILTGAGEWLWRPVANRDTLQISAFADMNPRGFGLLQRARTFDAFDDDDAHWELRPSLWIEPIGDWGDGEVILLEIPSDSENNDNIIAQWRPKAGLAAGGDGLVRLSPVLVLDAAVAPQPGDRRRVRAPARSASSRRFIVEFVADLFADPQKAAEVERFDRSGARTDRRRPSLYPYKERRSIRVVFDLDPGIGVLFRIAPVLKAAESTRQRDMALSMDS